MHACRTATNCGNFSSKRSVSCEMQSSRSELLLPSSTVWIRNNSAVGTSPRTGNFSQVSSRTFAVGVRMLQARAMLIAVPTLSPVSIHTWSREGRAAHHAAAYHPTLLHPLHSTLPRPAAPRPHESFLLHTHPRPISLPQTLIPAIPKSLRSSGTPSCHERATAVRSTQWSGSAGCGVEGLRRASGIGNHTQRAITRSVFAILQLVFDSCRSLKLQLRFEFRLQLRDCARQPLLQPRHLLRGGSCVGVLHCPAREGDTACSARYSSTFSHVQWWEKAEKHTLCQRHASVCLWQRQGSRI